jgi:peroxiredoxin
MRATTRRLIALIGFAFILSVDTAVSAEVKELVTSLGLNPVEDKVSAPDFTLTNLKNKKVKLSDYRGKLVLLNFMDTGCHWCQKEMPHLQKLYDQFKGRDFVILVVFTDRRGAEAVAPFLQESGYTFFADTGVLDPTGGVSLMYRVAGTPTTFLIDREGEIIAWGIGYRRWSSQKARDLIAGLLESGEGQAM